MATGAAAAATAGWACRWRMSNNINKPSYLAAARRQCKTTRRMRNFLVVIILRASERTERQALAPSPVAACCWSCPWSYQLAAEGVLCRQEEEGQPTRATRATRQPAKLFGRRRWLRLGFMRLNFTPYCVVAAGGLKTISDGISFYLFIVDFLFISIRQPVARQRREQPKPHSNSFQLRVESGRGCCLNWLRSLNGLCLG